MPRLLHSLCKLTLLLKAAPPGEYYFYYYYILYNNMIYCSTGVATGDTGMEIPEGVDPSFLEALPEDVRREVIAEQRRLIRLQQRSQGATCSDGSAGLLASEVSPEFLAALPPNLQEEVLAQQRLEQQRQAAAQANPDDPVDAAAFFQNLQPSLRQAVLFFLLFLLILIK